SRKRVLLMDRGRNSAHPRCQQDRPRRIAADAQNDVGTVFADHAPCLHESDGKARKVLDQVEPTFSLQAADGDELERKTGLRYDVFFETVLRADKDDTPLRIARPELLRDRNRRVDVASS